MFDPILNCPCGVVHDEMFHAEEKALAEWQAGGYDVWEE